MRHAMCAYGNCEETMPTRKGFKCTVTLSYNGNKTDTASFCCYEHAALHIQKWDRTVNGERTVLAARKALEDAAGE